MTDLLTRTTSHEVQSFIDFANGFQSIPNLPEPSLERLTNTARKYAINLAKRLVSEVGFDGFPRSTPEGLLLANYHFLNLPNFSNDDAERKFARDAFLAAFATKVMAESRKDNKQAIALILRQVLAYNALNNF